jgi:hypothetical protein
MRPRRAGMPFWKNASRISGRISGFRNRVKRSLNIPAMLVNEKEPWR